VSLGLTVRLPAESDSGGACLGQADGVTARQSLAVAARSPGVAGRHSPDAAGGLSGSESDPARVTDSEPRAAAAAVTVRPRRRPGLGPGRPGADSESVAPVTGRVRSRRASTGGAAGTVSLAVTAWPRHRDRR
jgi:hypothetical protein